jgi:GAF domain-containing protein
MSQGNIQQQLEVNLNPESLLRRILNRIRRSLELQEILDATVAEVRSFLGTDRVKIYKFNLDKSGLVIAESIHKNRLPSLLGLNFPADDIPPQARELFVQARVRSIVDVDSRQIGQSPLRDMETGEISFEDMHYRLVDSCHAEYLTAMGVKSSVVVPILHRENLWGLLVSHHSEPKAISEAQLQGIQLVVDQLCVAIAHSILLTQARAKAEREATLHRIATLLHSLPTIELKTALEETVAAFGGSGGRLCTKDYRLNLHRSLTECLEAGSEHVLVYTCGKQPQMPAPVKYPLLEQYSIWQERYKSGEYEVWAISDIYQTPQLRNLQIAFRPTEIRSLLMIPLYYHQQLLGYLTIFRDVIDTETLWAGKFDQDGRQLYPRLSFELWRQTLSAQAREWTKQEIELAQALSQQFATAIDRELYQHVQTLNTNLEHQVLEQTIQLQQVTEQQQLLFEFIAKIRSSLDLDTIFNTTTKELSRVINSDRVAVYRFDPDAEFNEGEFITEDVREGLPSTLGIKVYDRCFGENYATKYSQGRVHVVADINNAGLPDCHVAVLVQFQIKAQIVMPLMKGNQLWGLLCIHQCHQPRVWETSEIQLAIQIANQLSAALEQADLLAQTRKQAFDLKQAGEQQRVLFEVVAKMRKSLDLDLIFSTMSKEVRHALNADRVGLYRFDPDSEYNDGEFVAEDVVSGFPSTIAAKIHDHCFGELYASKYSRGRVHAVADFQNSGFEPCYLAIMEQFQVKANIIAPVMKGNQLWGLLCVHQCASPRQWQLGEIQFATQVAAQLSVALEQADLLAQTKQQAVDLQLAANSIQQAAEQQQILFEVVTKLRESLDLDVIFQTATQEVCKSLHGDRVAVYRFSPDWSGEFISEFVTPGWVKLVGADIKTVWEDTYLQETQGGRYRHNETFAVDDIYQVGHSECHVAILEQFQVKAYAIAPIFLGQQLWGLLAAYQNSSPRHWDGAEIKFLVQIANQLGVAIQQADLLAQTREQAQQLAQALQELQQTQTQLIQTEKMSSLGQLVAGIAHEINNPVNFIYGNISHAREYSEDLIGLLELYQRHCPNPHPEIGDRSDEIDLEFLVEDLPKMLSSMKVGAERIRQLVLSLRNFSRLEEAEMKRVNIHEGIDSTLLILQHRFKAKSDSVGIELIKEYGNLPLVECYPGQLNQVFMNAIANAVDALEQALDRATTDRPKILIQTSVVGENVAICIADNGIGMPESVRARIFDPFFTTKPVGKGTGLGLSISYQIVVEKHGGTLECTSQPGQGTQFLLQIPILQPNLPT